jgi:hypothetical protein
LQAMLNTFNGEQQKKLEESYSNYIHQSSNKEFIWPFLERVKESDAPDYRNIIAAEMYFELVLLRIKNGFYRSQEVRIKLN